MRKTFKKLFVTFSAIACVLSSSIIASAAEDDVEVVEAVKSYTSGAAYTYVGFASTGIENASDYKYLVISYKGSASGFQGFRFETCLVDSSGAESNKTGAFWIKDMADIPAATEDVQTAVIDLSTLAGINMDFNSFHLHTGGDSAWSGEFEITRFMLTKEKPSAEDLTEAPTEEAEETTAAASDDKDEATTKAPAADTAEDGEDDNNLIPIIIFIAGGVLVGYVAYKVSKNFA